MVKHVLSSLVPVLRGAHVSFGMALPSMAASCPPSFGTMFKKRKSILLTPPIGNKLFSVFWLIAFFCSPLHAASLNDTGQTWCYDATGVSVSCAVAADDGRYGRDAAATANALPKVGGGHAGFDFTALDVSGNPTTPSSGATPHPCVRDNVTGLTWEVKTNDSSLRDKDWTYTWYSTDASSNGGYSGTQNGGVCVGSRCDTQSFVTAVNATALCGYTDWRVPTKRELLTIVDYGVLNPAIDSTYFPNTILYIYWSASLQAPRDIANPSPILVMCAFFGYVNGRVSYCSISGEYSLRLVRGGLF